MGQYPEKMSFQDDCQSFPLIVESFFKNKFESNRDAKVEWSNFDNWKFYTKREKDTESGRMYRFGVELVLAKLSSRV